MNAPSAFGALWADTAPPAAAYPSLKEKTEAGFIIVGAGFTGLSTALALASTGRSVVVVEAGDIGSGSSGVSGGQVLAGLRHFTTVLVDAYGQEAGLKAHAFGGGVAETTFDLIRRYGIDCDALQVGKIQVSDTAEGLSQLKRRVDAWAGAGAPVRALDAEELTALTGTRAYGGGWIDRQGGTVQPLALARGLGAAAAAAGARIFTHSRATKLRRSGSAWAVTTPEGSVTAPKLLLATNGAQDDLWPDLRKTTLKAWSYQIATKPLPDDLRRVILAQGQAVSDTRRVLRYFRRDAHGRVIVGGKGKARAPSRVSDFHFQKMTLARLYPELADYPIEYAWGGQVSISVDRLPRVIGLGDGGYAHLGCNGNGVAWCTAMGARLAEALAENAPGALPIPVTPVTPIPFHHFRGAYVALGGAWFRFRDTIEESGGSLSGARRP